MQWPVTAGGSPARQQFFLPFPKILAWIRIRQRRSCGFGAGISKTGNLCGAVSGAILVIGLKYGKTVANDDAATEKTRALVRQFIHEFEEKNGSINCTDLLGYNLGSPEEFARARDQGLFVTKCTPLVRDAADILEKIVHADAYGKP